MRPLMLMVFLLLGLSGPGLLRLHLLMLFGLVVDLSGGPLSGRGLVLGRGSASFRVVRLGGHQDRKARADVADALDAADVFLSRDSSVAPLLDMRRRFKAVVDVLGAMIRSGISLSRSVELAVQWDRILALGPTYPVTLDDLSLNRGMDVGAFFHAASDVHRRLSDFIHQVVVHRRDEAIRGCGFPTFAVLGKGRPAFTNSILRLLGGCHFYLRFICPG